MMTRGRGEVVEIETWVGASGKNGMRRDWVVTSQHTGQIFARATRQVHHTYVSKFHIGPKSIG